MRRVTIPTVALITLLVVLLGFLLSPDLQSRLMGSVGLDDTEVNREVSIAVTPLQSTPEPDDWQVAEDSEGVVDPNGYDLITWAGLQNFADQTLGLWYTHEFQPEDINSGYLDGVIGGGLDVATRFRLNKVSVFLADLGERDGCLFHLAAVAAEDSYSQSYGTISIDLTATGARCEEPQDLVGEHLVSRTSEEYRVEVSSHLYLDSDNRERWSTLWTNTKETEQYFEVFVTGIDGEYLLGTFDGHLRLNTYMGQDMNAQHRQGRLYGIFRAKL